MKKLILLFCSILFLSFFSPKIKAQSLPVVEQQNCEKYQKMRQRFIEQFIVVGAGTGKSLPIKNDLTNFNGWGEFKTMNANAKGRVRWSDATFYLGDYLTVLATEFALYQKHGWNTQQTVIELYYALQAFNRLDSLAEHYLDDVPAHNQQYESNGFFVRDDIDQQFVGKYFKRLTYRSDKKEFAERKAYNAMSQDHLVNLLFGLSFVQKFCPSNLRYKNIYIAQETKDIADRLLHFVRLRNWEITNPLTEEKVPRGASAFFQSFPIAKIGKQITGRHYQTFWSNTAGRLAWKLAQRPFRKLARYNIKNPFRPNKKQRLVYDDVNNSMMLRLAAVSNTWHKKKVLVNSLAANMEVFILAHAVMNQYQPKLDPIYFADMLAAMPEMGPYCFDYQQKAKGGWASSDRWGHPDVRYKGYNDGHPETGEYAALDYMLLFNLYHLAYGHKLSPNCKK